MQTKRIGIFGGTFNPIHLGHLRSAEEVREAQQLAQVWFTPSGSPPHKAWHGVAPGLHRAQMIRLAITGNRAFRLCTVELERHGHSYSIDTVRELCARHPEAELAFILGLDAFREIATWKDYAGLFSLCDLIVTSRPGGALPRRPRELLPVAARESFWYQPDSATLTHHSGHRIVFQQLTDLDVSATTIRERIRSGSSVRYLLPPTVERYIRQHHLYGERGVAR